jgi:4-amino-4-deoxy-L-arabinose transferase-like glycosyltransferase
VIKHRRLLLILVLALALRVLFALAQDPTAPYADRSNDAGWYLGNAYALMTGHFVDAPVSLWDRLSYLTQPYTLITGRTWTMYTNTSHLASPPLYFIVIGLPESFLSPASAVIAVRVFQAILSTATCFFAYRLALLLTRREGAGLLAAGILALSPVFIIESSQILTETLYIFLIAGGVWLYIETVVQKRSLSWLILAAVCFGLATLTRAVLLAFPFALVLHLLLVRGWRNAWRQVLVFLLVYMLVVSTWTIYSVARWNRFVIAGEGLSANLYIGATGGWNGAAQVDQSLEASNGNYMQGAETAISSDPVGWVEHRVEDLLNAYLQPHGTTFFPGASLKELALDWLHQDRSLSGLIALTQGDYFWPKLALYALHYVGLIAGLVGVWLYRRRWQIALPMIGFIIYVTCVHLALLALPRYLFPTEIFWWVFAAAALYTLFNRLRGQRSDLTSASVAMIENSESRYGDMIEKTIRVIRGHEGYT